MYLRPSRLRREDRHHRKHKLDDPPNMIDPINFVLLFSSFHLFKSFHVANWSLLCSWCPRWYSSIFDGLVFVHLEFFLAILDLFRSCVVSLVLCVQCYPHLRCHYLLRLELFRDNLVLDGCPLTTVASFPDNFLSDTNMRRSLAVFSDLDFSGVISLFSLFNCFLPRQLVCGGHRQCVGRNYSSG